MQVQYHDTGNGRANEARHYVAVAAFLLGLFIDPTISAAAVLGWLVSER